VWAKYLLRYPAPSERVEYQIADLSTHFVNVHKPKGAALRKLSDSLLFEDPWAREELLAKERYSATDKSLMAMLMGSK